MSNVIYSLLHVNDWEEFCEWCEKHPKVEAVEHPCDDPDIMTIIRFSKEPHDCGLIFTMSIGIAPNTYPMTSNAIWLLDEWKESKKEKKND